MVLSEWSVNEHGAALLAVFLVLWPGFAALFVLVHRAAVIGAATASLKSLGRATKIGLDTREGAVVTVAGRIACRGAPTTCFLRDRPAALSIAVCSERVVDALVERTLRRSAEGLCLDAEGDLIGLTGEVELVSGSFECQRPLPPLVLRRRFVEKASAATSLGGSVLRREWYRVASIAPGDRVRARGALVRSTRPAPGRGYRAPGVSLELSPFRLLEPEGTHDEAKTTNVQMAFDGVPASSWLSTAPKLLALAALPAAAGAIFVVALYSL